MRRYSHGACNTDSSLGVLTCELICHVCRFNVKTPLAYVVCSHTQPPRSTLQPTCPAIHIQIQELPTTSTVLGTHSIGRDRATWLIDGGGLYYQSIFPLLQSEYPQWYFRQLSTAMLSDWQLIARSGVGYNGSKRQVMPYWAHKRCNLNFFSQVVASPTNRK